MRVGRDGTPRPFTRVAARHGIGAKVARVLHEVGNELRELTIETGVEHAALVDAETGVRLGEIIVGTKSETDMSPLLAAALPGRLYISIHTHPGSAAFSRGDALHLVANTNVRALMVQGVDGTRYFLSRAAGLPANDQVPYRILAEWFVERSRLLPKLATKPLSDLDRDAAGRWLAHEIWRNIARRVGLEYSRLEPREEP